MTTPAISMLIKPASSSCNMRCEYCFYHDVTAARAIPNYGMMSFATLETIVQKAFSYATELATFGFQGGEPTLAGLDFFREVVRLQKLYNTKHIKVSNAIQTNGLSMNEEWATFLHDNHFLVGLSLDGNQLVHDKYRLDATGSGTFDRVLSAARLMDKYKVEYNILTTVNIDVANNIEKIYYFFKKQRFNYLQFIPCLDEFHGADAGQRSYSLTAKAYGDFLIKLFRLWYVDINSSKPVSIRLFDNLAMMMYGYPPESCGMSGHCTCYYMIEADGGVYPCDFYVTDRWRLGSIIDEDFSALLNKPRAEEFVAISRQVADQCRDCEHYHLCRGGCRREREPIELDSNNGNRLCTPEGDGLKAFYDYAKADLQKVADKFLSRS